MFKFIRDTREAGFTLLELLIVVIIVGILASVAIPQFTRATDRTREAEGRNALDSVLTAESAYYQDRGTFTGLLSELLVNIPVMTNWTPPAFSGVTGVVCTVQVNGNASGPPGGHNHSTHIITGIINNAGSKTVSASGAS